MPSAGRFASHGLTDIGLVRARNEDAFLERPEIALWVVADGMGGHDKGDEASAAIVTALAALRPRDLTEIDDYVDEVKKPLTLVDRDLRARAAVQGPGAVIASTVVALFIYGDDFGCLWAGDSRLYLLRDGEFRQLTTDHSLVQEMTDAGQLTPEQAALHPNRNVVTQAIGGGRFLLGVRAGNIRPGDRFLLCSDGLTNMVADTEIAGHLNAEPAPKDAAERLRDLVLARGAIDNVTLVIVDVARA
jgi:serine/threonine protein phosphatase PrpC